MRRDLEHAVGRRVHDGRAGPHMFSTEPIDDLGSGRNDIAENRAPDPLFEVGDEVRRKSLWVGRERALEHNAHQLPMARDGVLSWRLFSHAPVCGARLRRRRHTLERRDRAQAKRRERRDPKRPRSGDVSQRVTAFVTVLRSVGQLADPDAVEHENDRPRGAESHRTGASDDAGAAPGGALAHQLWEK